MINRITNQETFHNNKNKDRQSFKGNISPVVSGLRALNQSPAIGACAVDLCSMVIPRTLIEFKNRGRQAGIETGIREGSSNIINSCLGLIGFAAASLVSKKFNQKFGVKAQNIMADSNTIGNLSSIWEKAEGNSGEFFESFINNIKGLDGNKWKHISSESKASIIENLVKLSEKAGDLAAKSGAEKKALSQEVKNLKSLVSAQIIKDTGAQASYKLSAIKDEAGNVIHKEIKASINDLIDNATSMSNALKNKTKEEMPTFINALKKNKAMSTIIGLGICSLLCLSIQPINKYLTKKRTGQDGFVGVENKTADKSKKFKATKTAMGIIGTGLAVRTIGNPKDLLSNVQFNSKIPSINHFKLIYGLTIASRFMSARDKNELRETAIKDTMGFTNWLILGGMVSKLTARLIGGKELINNPIADEGKKGIKYAAKWLTKASVKSFDEVLLPNAKEIAKDGKLLKFKEILKNADAATKSKVLKVAGSQIAGYLYSGLVLGVGIAKLNIFITKQVEARRKAKNQMNEEVSKTVKIDTCYISNIKSSKNPIFKDFN